MTTDKFEKETAAVVRRATGGTEKFRRERGKKARARRDAEKREKKKGAERRGSGELYPVEIPRFVRRQFEFYYRREGLRSTRDIVVTGRSEARKTDARRSG